METSYDYRGDTATEYVVQAVELDDPQPVDYRLTITVTDRVTGEVKKRTAEFGMRE